MVAYGTRGMFEIDAQCRVPAGDYSVEVMQGILASHFLPQSERLITDVDMMLKIET